VQGRRGHICAGAPPATRINQLGTGEAVTLEPRDRSMYVGRDGESACAWERAAAVAPCPWAFFRKEQLSPTASQELLLGTQPGDERYRCFSCVCWTKRNQVVCWRTVVLLAVMQTL